jgi:hypothetical protein
MQIAVPELVGGGLLLIIINVAVWIFAWGKTVGKIMEAVETLKREFQEHKEDRRCHDIESMMKLTKAVSSLMAKVDMICGRE